jgi:hypothetical protein
MHQGYFFLFKLTFVEPVVEGAKPTPSDKAGLVL